MSHTENEFVEFVKGQALILLPWQEELLRAIYRGEVTERSRRYLAYHDFLDQYRSESI